MSMKKKKPVLTLESSIPPVFPEVSPIASPEALPIPAMDANPPEGISHATGGILDPLLVLRLAFLQEKVTRLQAQLSGYHLLFTQRRKELEEVRFATLTKADRDLSTAGAEYKGAQDEIEKKHGIVLDHYTFDPDTGMLNLIANEEKNNSAVTEERAKPNESVP